MIALDLFVALMTADIPNRDAIVLVEILSQSYGPAKRRNVLIDPATLEDITGLHRNNVRRGLASLVEAHIIARNNDGTYRFLKDWERYAPSGKPFVERLNGGLAVFARNVKTRFGRIKGSAKDAIHLDSGKSQNPNPVGLRKTDLPESKWIGPTVDALPENGDVTPSDDTTSVSSLAGAGAHAELNSIQTLKFNTRSVRTRGDFPEPEDEEPFHADATPPPPPEPQPIGVNSVADCQRTKAAAEEFFPMTSVATLCQQWLTDHPARKVIAAMAEAKDKGIAKPSRYIQAVLDNPRFGETSAQPARRSVPRDEDRPELKPWVFPDISK